MRVVDAFRQLNQTLSSSYASGEARSMARIVFEDAFGIRNIYREDTLASSQLHRLKEIQDRLLAGEPVQYVLGQARFYGIDLKVTPAVLIPRQETEELVHWVLETQKTGEVPENAVILDVGTGSGCIPIALGKHGTFRSIWGIDKSRAALRVATENAEKSGVPMNLVWADILDPLSFEDLPEADILISNPPYIPRREKDRMPDHVLAHEPAMALFVEDHDPLVFYRAILDLAHVRLRSGGWLFLELNEFHADKVELLLVQANYCHIEIKPDMQGKPRMARARKPVHL